MSEETAERFELAGSPPMDWRVDRAFRAVALALGPRSAVEVDEQTLTYAELEIGSNRLARRLLEHGVREGDIVALACDDAMEFALGALAIMKTGAAYLSIDLRFSLERGREVLKAGAARHIIGPANLADRFGDLQIDVLEDAFSIAASAGFDGSALDAGIGPNDPAYLCYTSGTSGVPKGALIPQGGIFGLTLNPDFASIAPGARVASCSTFAFDAITFEVWASLLKGATVVQIDRSVVTAPHRIEDDFSKLKIDAAFLTTSLFNAVVASRPAAFGGLSLLVIGGEAVDPVYVGKLFEGDRAPRQILNGYGPTEATTFALTHTITQEDVQRGVMPIGRPIPGRYVRLLRPDLSEAGADEPGELCLGGPALALEYINAPEMTAEKFIPDHRGRHGAARLYRTGDLCRMNTVGVVEYLGRIDDQLKVRGYRVEPAGVAALLRQSPAIDEAVVLPRPGRFGGREIVAFIKGSNKYPRSVLLAEASKLMPDYMLPSDFIWVDKFPFTDNGKIDAEVLLREAPSIVNVRIESGKTNETAEKLRVIWRRNTRINDVDLDTPFDQFGDSLSLIGVLLDVERELGVSLSPFQIKSPITIHTMAECVDGDKAAFGDHSVFYISQPWNMMAASKRLGAAIAGDRPWRQLQIPFMHTLKSYESVSHMASILEGQLSLNDTRPIVLAGHSFGGVLAYELTHRLEARGHPVACTILIDSYLLGRRRWFETGLVVALRAFVAPQRLFARLIRYLTERNRGLSSSDTNDISTLCLDAMSRYAPKPIRTPLLLARCTGFDDILDRPMLHWRKMVSPWERLALGEFKCLRLNCTHLEVITDPKALDQLSAAVSAFTRREEDVDAVGEDGEPSELERESRIRLGKTA